MAQLIDFTGMEFGFVRGSASGKQYPVTEFTHPSATGQLCWDSVKLRLCPLMGTRIDCVPSSGDCPLGLPSVDLNLSRQGNW